MRYPLSVIKERGDKNIQERFERLQTDTTTLEISNDYDDSFSFRTLFIKLVFEYLQKDLTYNQDFQILFEYIKTFGRDISCVKLKMIDTTSLKSNNYWLMGIIPKLTELKILKLYQNESVLICENTFKFLTKAMSYL